MRSPQWYREAVETYGRQYANSELDASEVHELLADTIADHPDHPFGREVHVAFGAKEFRKWRDQQQTAAREEAEIELQTGFRQEELIPGLPRSVEVSPGRFIDQPSLDGAALDAAKRQLEVKKDNVNGAWDRFMAIYKHYRPLLTDGKTIADVVADIEGYGDAEGTV